MEGDHKMAGYIDEARLADCVPLLTRFANSLTRNPDWAADLVQDSVERAIRKAHLFDGTNLQGWLHTICRRIFLNEVRRNAARGASVDLDTAPASKLCIDEHQETDILFKD